MFYQYVIRETSVDHIPAIQDDRPNRVCAYVGNKSCCAKTRTIVDDVKNRLLRTVCTKSDFMSVNRHLVTHVERAVRLAAVVRPLNDTCVHNESEPEL